MFCVVVPCYFVCALNEQTTVVRLHTVSGQDGDKPQFIPSKDMTTSTKEMLPPPDREAVRTYFALL